MRPGLSDARKGGLTVRATNRAEGRGPCGACAWCCKQASSIAEKAIAHAEAAEKLAREWERLCNERICLWREAVDRAESARAALDSVEEAFNNVPAYYIERGKLPNVPAYYIERDKAVAAVREALALAPAFAMTEETQGHEPV